MFGWFRKKVTDEPLAEQRAEVAHSTVSDLILSGEDCDELPAARGQFGLDQTNPIPVNGVIGERKYLGRMRRVGTEAALLFHRLGSLEVAGLEGNVDLFECVTLDGQDWEVLALHMYHPRRSRKAPRGYTFSIYHELFSRVPIVPGTTRTCYRFPHDIPEALLAYGDSTPLQVFARYIGDVIAGASFQRPDEHLVYLHDLADRGIIERGIFAPVATPRRAPPQQALRYSLRASVMMALCDGSLQPEEMSLLEAFVQTADSPADQQRMRTVIGEHLQTRPIERLLDGIECLQSEAAQLAVMRSAMEMALVDGTLNNAEQDGLIRLGLRLAYRGSWEQLMRRTFESLR